MAHSQVDVVHAVGAVEQAHRGQRQQPEHIGAKQVLHAAIATVRATAAAAAAAVTDCATAAATAAAAAAASVGGCRRGCRGRCRVPFTSDNPVSHDGSSRSSPSSARINGCGGSGRLSP